MEDQDPHASPTPPATASAPAKTQRGFALMDPGRLKNVSSRGGKAPRAAKRGFAAMDEARRREVSQKGLLARRAAPQAGAADAAPDTLPEA